ncbi:hypothetical protein AVEN_65417-1, partial [Araneus ventricosus]
HTTPELEPPLLFNVQQAHIHGGSSVVSDLEPGAIRLRSRDLIARTPRSHKVRSCGSENPKISIEHERDISKLNAWCGLSHDAVIGVILLRGEDD